MSIDIRCYDCNVSLSEPDEIYCEVCAGKEIYRYDCPMDKCTHNKEGGCNTKPEFRFNNSFADDGSPKLECPAYCKQIDENLYFKMDTERNILTSS